MEYRVARPHPLPDSVVTWAGRDIADNCASISISDGQPYEVEDEAEKDTGTDNPIAQTIATSFISSTSSGEQCMFLEGMS
jgi:hypothetical protein